jgi:MinD-like ATPase involved in chromosome partitioning or flagellar assembly
MKNKRRIIGIVAATVLALIGTLALVTYVRSATDDAVADEALVDVYVVDEFVPKGAEPDTIMSAVSIEQVPARLVQAGALTDLEQVGEQVAASDLQPGDQLLAARLAAKELVTEEVTDKVQISALLEAERAVGGALKKGDLVGVYLSFDPFDVDVSGQDFETEGAPRPKPLRSLPRPTSRDRSRGDRHTPEEDPEREPAGVPQRPGHQRADDQRPGDPPTTRRRRADRCPGDRHAVRGDDRPVARAVGAIRVRQGIRQGLAVARPGHRRRRRHPTGHPRQRVHGGEVMQNQTPTVVVGRDMSPELFVDVSATLSSLGVVVETDGFAAAPRRSKVIVVVSPKGGAGKTAVSSNLSVALAQRHPGRVVAVDLDVQFGDLGLALSLSPERTLAQLARSSQIDATTLKLHLTPAPNGLFVLAGANDPVDADSIGHAHVSQVLPMLAENFDFVVVDTPAGLDELTLAALECATDLLLVSSLDVTSIRSLRNALDAFDHIGISAERTLLLNRADSKVGLNPSDAEDVMGMKIACSIPSSREIPLSLNLGTPVVISEPKSAVAKQLQQLALLFAPSNAEPTRKGWRR